MQTSPNIGIAAVATAIPREAGAATPQAMLVVYELAWRLEDVSKLQLSITHAQGYDLILLSPVMMRIGDMRAGGRLFAKIVERPMRYGVSLTISTRLVDALVSR